MKPIFYRILLLIYLLFPLHYTACATRQEEKKDEPNAEKVEALRETTDLFYRYMNWEMFEEASQFVNPEERSAFLHEYADHKEDFDITDISLVTLKALSATEVKIVTRVEWYQKPAHILKNKKFVEIWSSRVAGWQLDERLPEEEYKILEKDRQKEKKGVEVEQRERGTNPTQVIDK